MAVNDALFLDGMKQAISEIFTRALIGHFLPTTLFENEAQHDRPIND
jgi:hypothetical protein